MDDARATLRVLIASLAPGGAERIVLEWLAAERARGREAQLAVLHPRRNALAVPQGLDVRMRARESPESFVAALGHDWRGAPAPVSTHLITDDLLEILWRCGVRTVPTVHNHRDGWRNDPSRWNARDVPAVVACAESVRLQLLDAGCRIPVYTVRHRPRVDGRACDEQARRATRDALRVPAETLLVGAIGAIKPQKDYARAVEVLAAVHRHRDAMLVILGGVLSADGLGEIDRVMTRAVKLGVADRLRLPGFVSPVEPWLAACDVVVNVSRFEGLSIAVQEALAAGLPVIATDVGGQAEISHPALEHVAADARCADVASRVMRHPVRKCLEPRPFVRSPRTGSLALCARTTAAPRIDTLFVTANLNAGGAQRSLVNLARAIAPRHRIAVAVCGDTTHSSFFDELRRCAIETFRPAASPDPFAVAESLLAHAAARGAASVCFWNADARVKLLVAKFAPDGLRLVDASPGDYAFAEMEAAAPFSASVATSAAEYQARLDTLVVKYEHAPRVACRHLAVIPNGVEFLAPSPRAGNARFLVSGRIAPSKRIEDVLAAFAQARETLDDAQLHVFGRIEERHAGYAATLALDGPGVVMRGESFDHAHFREPWTAAVVIGTHQGSPNAVLEAQAAGVAVIANDSGGTRETVIDGQTGWLLAADAGADAIAAAMHAAAVDGMRAGAMAARGRERVRASRTIGQMAGLYLAILAPESASAHEKMQAWTQPPESQPTFASQASNP